MTVTAPRALWRKPTIRRTVIALISLFVLYALFGFYVLPRIVQAEVPKLVAQKLHRNLSITKVEINPFTLLVTVRGVKLMEAQGNRAFASFDALTVKISAQSLRHFAPVVQEVLLSNPDIHIVREDARHYNFDDIMQTLSQPQQPQQPQSDSGPARFSVYNIQLTGGRIEFEDKPRGQTHVLDQLAVGVPFISSLPSQVEVFVEPLLSANIDGAPIHFAGKTRPYAEPREASLTLKLADVDLGRYIDYLPLEAHFKVPSARMDLTLNANFRQARGQSPALLIDGSTNLKSLKITDGDGKQVATLDTLEIALGKSDVLGERIEVDHVTLNGFSADIARERDGRTNLQRLFDIRQTDAKPNPTATTPAAAAEKTSQNTPPHLAIKLGRFNISNAALRFADDSHGLHTSLDKFALKVEDATFDLAGRNLTIGQVTSDSADIALKIGKITGTAAVNTTPAAHPQTPTTASPFIVKVAKLNIDNWNAHLEDGRQAKPVDTVIAPLSLAMNGWSNSPAVSAQIDLKANVNRGGTLALAGKVGLSPLHVDTTIDIKTVDLLGLQPYVTDKCSRLPKTDPPEAINFTEN